MQSEAIEITYRKCKVVKIDDAQYGVVLKFVGTDGTEYTSTLEVGGRYCDVVTKFIDGVENKAEEARDRRRHDIWERT